MMQDIPISITIASFHVAADSVSSLHQLSKMNTQSTHPQRQKRNNPHEGNSCIVLLTRVCTTFILVIAITNEWFPSPSDNAT